MINIFYEPLHSIGHLNGPSKVISNLFESLEQEKISYAINEEKYEYNLLLHYDAIAQGKHSKLTLENCLIGPNFWIFDDYGKFLIENPDYYKGLLAPSWWVKNLFVSKFPIHDEKVFVWPVGISDLPTEKNIEIDCLIYYKRRTDHELSLVKRFLDEKRITYKVVRYGNYDQQNFLDDVSKVKFCFLLNGSESQGIAVQEIMSTNTPLFVWDIKEWGDQGDRYRVPCSSIPYWSDECGEVIFSAEEMESKFSHFYDIIDSYNPKSFIERELSYKASVQKLLGMFQC
jgi:hypothetical protein